jgi:hypothetical protein
MSMTSAPLKSALTAIKPMIISFLVLVFCCCGEANAANLLFVDVSGGDTPHEAEMRKVCEYLGLEFKKCIVQKQEDQERINDILRNTVTVAIAINARSLRHISRDQVIKQIGEHEKNKGNIAVIITGIDSRADADDLIRWSAGAVSSVDTRSGVVRGSLIFGDAPDLNRSLSRQHVAGAVDRLSYFVLNSEKKRELVAGFKEEQDSGIMPVMIKVKLGSKDIYLAADFHFIEVALDDRGTRCSETMTALPLFVPVKAVCGEYCWHNPRVTANFSIDDPFLVEPYGNLSYAGLLRAMEQSRYHTTIAFIPWNYNRSEKDAVEIVKANPDQYSISVHGNDHGLKELQGTGETGKDERHVAVALDRMDAFRNLTGIEYDKVMIFPRNPGTAGTMRMLKKFNFLGTANWRNIPSDISRDTEGIQCLREPVVNVGGFPSLKRYNPRVVSDFQLALAIFFEAPVLFQAHQHDFQRGMDWFNPTADKVNRMYPKVEWVSLGNVFRNLYMKRKVDEQNWDVSMYSRDIKIENTGGKCIVYHIRKDDDFSIPIKRVIVQGKEHPFETVGGEITMTVAVPPGEMREIVIEYENNQMVGPVDLSKADMDAKIIRGLAEYRDRELSRTDIGRQLSGILYPTGNTRDYVIYTVLLIFSAFVMICFWIKKRKRPLK